VGVVPRSAGVVGNSAAGNDPRGPHARMLRVSGGVEGVVGDSRVVTGVADAGAAVVETHRLHRKREATIAEVGIGGLPDVGGRDVAASGDVSGLNARRAVRTVGRRGGVAGNGVVPADRTTCIEVGA